MELAVVALAVAAAAAVLLWTVPPRRPWLPPESRRGVRLRGAASGSDRGNGTLAPGAGAGWDVDERQAPAVLVPEGLELLALALLGGGSLGAAARTVAGTLPGTSGEGLDLVAAALHRGADTEAAWERAGESWEPARRSLELAALAGVAPGAALRQTASDLRSTAVADVEVATARLGVRMVLPLGLAFLPGFVLTTVLPLVLALTRDLSW